VPAVPARRIVTLPGDGIGPEIMGPTLELLNAVGEFEFEEHVFGGASIDAHGTALTGEVLDACRRADAVLLAAVGGPKWDTTDPHAPRPEAGLLGLRKELDVYANLRPAMQGNVDLVIVRELVGGLYFGARGVRDDGTVFDTLEYHPAQIERVVRRGFELAAARTGSLVSVDKANVLDTSRLWRRIVNELAPEYPNVQVRHALVDSFAMELVSSADRIDVAVTENMFGDILSDLTGELAGSLGIAPSLNASQDRAMAQAAHGSAPDIAGHDRANPIAMILSTAMLFDWLGARHHDDDLVQAASMITRGVEETVAQGISTPDMGGDARCQEFAEAVAATIKKP